MSATRELAISELTGLASGDLGAGQLRATLLRFPEAEPQRPGPSPEPPPHKDIVVSDEGLSESRSGLTETVS